MKSKEGEDKALGGDDAQEHCQRVDRRVGDGRGVARRRLACVGQCGRVGIGAGKQAHNVEEVDFIDLAGYEANNHKREEGDYEAPDYPPHTGLVEDRGGKILARGDAHRGKEEADSEFAHKQRGR